MTAKTVKFLKFSPQRTFGVEMEWADSGLTREQMRTIIQGFPGERATITGYMHNEDPQLWYCKTDSSCGLEVATRVLGSMSSVKKTLDDLKMVSEVHSELYQKGARINDNCGGHVHIGVSDLSQEQFVRFLMYWVKLEKFIVDIMPRRRKNNRFAPIQSTYFRAGHKYDLQAIRAAFSGRTAVNLGHYRWSASESNRIEVRIAEGSNDHRDVKNWVRFLLWLIDRAATALPDPENMNWLTLDEGMKVLGLVNDPDSEDFYVLSPALSELRQWILARAQAYANLRDGEKVRTRAKELETKLYETPYGMGAETLAPIASITNR